MSHPTITSERIDDVPVLIHWLLEMHIDKIIDELLGPTHGNRQGLSHGQLAVVFVAYVLSESNHFLSPVRDWVLERRECLVQTLGEMIRDTDFTDDRLEAMLDVLGTVEVGEQIDLALGQHLIRAYALSTETTRIDTTTVSVYHQPEGASMLAFGVSKDHRPDLRQFKQVLGTLDPAGIPLCSTTTGGQRADDPLYLPAWQRMVDVIGHADFLTVGDCKMASLETRAQIQHGQGYYLVPAPMTGTTAQELRHWVLAPPATPQEIYLSQAAPDDPAVGQGFEVSVERTWTSPNNELTVSWQERVLVVCSDKLARRQQRALEERMLRAEKALATLKPGSAADLASLTLKSQAILEKHHVADYLQVTWVSQTKETKHYLKRGRHGPDSPFEMVTTTSWQLIQERQIEAIKTSHQLAGWRLYLTNALAQRLDLPGAVACYREQWQPERDFHRLKGASLAIRPLLLRSDQRITGLLCLLVIALRALTLIEFVARRNLAQQSEPLQGLYDGNPTRATTQPTTERLLKAFDNLTLYRVVSDSAIWYQVTPMSALQHRILDLLGIPETIYSKLAKPELASP